MIGALFALGLILTAAVLVLGHRKQIEEIALTQLESQAASIEDQTVRLIDASDLVMHSLADTFSRFSKVPDDDRAAQILQERKTPMPFLRSISILDRRHAVLVSSNPGNRGVKHFSYHLPLPFDESAVRLGGLVGGFDLADATVPTREPKSANFLTLTRAFKTAEGIDSYLVAVIDLTYPVSQHHSTLEKQSGLAAVLSNQGQLIASTDAVSSTPGMSRSKHLIFSEMLLSSKRGVFIGQGLRGDHVAAAFRGLRRLPLVVVVEQSYDVIDVALNKLVRRVAVLTILACILIAALVAIGRRWLEDQEPDLGLAGGFGHVIELNLQRPSIDSVASGISGVELIPGSVMRNDLQGALRSVRRFVTVRAAGAGLPELVVGLLEIAAVEVFTNVVRHGKGLPADAALHVVTRVINGNFEIDVVHLGEPYAPKGEHIDADVSEFPEGGFGLLIMDAVCDRILYLRSNGLNIIRLTKSIKMSNLIQASNSFQVSKSIGVSNRVELAGPVS